MIFLKEEVGLKHEMQKHIEGELLSTDDVGFGKRGIVKIELNAINIKIIIGIKYIDDSGSHLDFGFSEKKIIIGR